jgi:hypothetical protein
MFISRKQYRVFNEFQVSMPVSTLRQLLHQQPAVHTGGSTSDKAKYLSPLTDGETSTINSTKRSSVCYDYMEQRLFIEIRRRDGLQCRQIHLKLLELYGDDAISYWEVCSWSWQFLMNRQYLEDAKKTGRPPISAFSFEFRVHSKRCRLPLFDALPRSCTFLQQPYFTF